MKKLTLGLLAALGLLLSAHSFADDKPKFTFHANGFIQLDTFHDSTRSLTEIPGNNPIELPTTAAGANGRTQMSARASRLRLTIDGPAMGSWATQGVMEWDFFGNQPAGTENNFFSTGLPRMRHMAFLINKPGWQILVGQYWSLFGVLDAYLPTTVAFRPPVGALLSRPAQVRVTHDLLDNQSWKASLAGAMVRPTERDSEIPNFDFAARLALKSLQSKWSIPFRAVHLETANVSFSGTLRQLVSPTSLTTKTSHFGHGLALSFMLPILPAHDLNSTSVTWTGEITTGTGISDHYVGFTANLPQLATATSASQPNIDAGIGGIRADNGAFEPLKVFVANTTLQLHPGDWDTFFNIYYGMIQSSNASLMTPATGRTIYTQMHSAAVNVFHDFSENIRAGTEYTWTKTNYVGGLSATNHRFQISGWFTF
jgi:hypothetical protein